MHTNQEAIDDIKVYKNNGFQSNPLITDQN
jgi:hypothetical protein